MSQVGEAHKLMQRHLEECERQIRHGRFLAQSGTAPRSIVEALDAATTALEAALSLAARIDSGTEFDS